MQVTSATTAPGIGPSPSSPPPHRNAWATPLAVGIVLIAALCWLAREAAIEGDYLHLETQWMAQVFAWRSPALDQAMRWIARAHDPAVILFIVGGIGVHAVQRRWSQVRWLVAAVPGGMLANLAVKALVARPRPMLGAMAHAHGYSFPSGHTVAATLMAGWLVLAVFQATRSLAWRTASLAGGTAVVCGVALSRVYLGVHYPTDVLAAVLAGAAWLGICLALQNAIRIPPGPSGRRLGAASGL